MRRGTTPTLTFKPSRDISGFARVVLTIKSSRRPLDFERDRMTFEDGKFRITLTQEETLALCGPCEVQLRAVTSDGFAVASNIVSIDAERIIKQGVLEASDG